MYIAKLYVGDSLFRTETIERPGEYIRIYTILPLKNAFVRSVEEEFFPMTMNKAVMIFRLDHNASYGQIYHSMPVFKYQFIYTEGTEKFSCPMHSTLDIGFEPNENVNLDNLKKKLRSREKMKELLLRYYRS